MIDIDKKITEYMNEWSKFEKTSESEVAFEAGYRKALVDLYSIIKAIQSNNIENITLTTS